jgi:hypothetical protein
MIKPIDPMLFVAKIEAFLVNARRRERPLW